MGRLILREVDRVLLKEKNFGVHDVGKMEVFVWLQYWGLKLHTPTNFKLPNKVLPWCC
jgi:hypothetical protein